MKITKPKLAKYFELPNPNLRAYFQRAKAGNKTDYRPPFWKGLTRPQVLEMWQRRLDSTRIKREFPGLYQYEMEMKGKVGPMSIMFPLDMRIESMKDYFATPTAEPISQEAIKLTINYFSGVKGIRLRNRVNTIDKMRLNTNSGSPYFTKRKYVVNKSQDGYEYCAVAGWRGQEGGISYEDVKQRVVWMNPFDLNVKELQFYQPLIEAIQRNSLIPAYLSMDAVDVQVTRLFDSKPKSDVVICTDFSKFDQHFGKPMQDAAHLILSSLADPNLHSSWFKEIFPLKFTLPLVCSEEIMISGQHGMGSGSGGTNIDESLSHRALMYEAALSAGAKLNPYSMAYGDDGILTYPGITVEHVIGAYEKHGLEMNPQKQMVSKTDCVVLRRWHSTKYRINGIMVGVYSTFRALGRLMAQERYYDPDIWGAKMVTLRAWSIIENCKYSPVFEEFVDFCMKGDKYKLGLLIPGFLDNVDTIAKEAIDVMPDFLGYTKSMQNDNSNGGIKQWRIYQYLKSKVSNHKQNDIKGES